MNWDTDWTEFRRLLELGDMRVFWTEYAKYLERMGLISPARITIYQAAIKTIAALSECPCGRGVPGNENIVNGEVLCDYCHCERLRKCT